MPSDQPIRRHCRLAVCAVLAAAAAPAADAKTKQANWLSATSGTWDVPSLWSSSPNYPNNGIPNNTDYMVSIAAAGSPYTVTLDTSVSITSLTLNSSAATLSQVAGTLNVQTLTLSAGQYVLAGGATLQGATVSGAGSFLVTPGFSSATLDGVTLGSNITVADLPAGSTGDLRIYNGLTLTSNATLSLGSTPAVFWGTQSLAGAGNVVFSGGGPNAGLYAAAGGTLTIGAGVHVQTGAQSGTVSANSNGFVINNGTLSSNVAGRQLSIFGPVTNFGTVEANNGGVVVAYQVDNRNIINAANSTLRLNGNWSSSGSINVTNSITELSGSFTTASLRTVHRTGGSLTITGTVDNTADTFVLDSVTGAWPFAPSAGAPGIRGGTITALNPTTGLSITQSTPATTLDSLTINTNLTLNSGLDLVGDVTIASGRSANLNGGASPYAAGYLTLDPGARLLGPGAVVFNSGTSVLSSPSAATLGPSSVVRTGAGTGVIAGPDPATSSQRLLLQGLVSAQTTNQTLTITGNWSNTGTLRSTGSNLILAGNTNGLGTLDARAGTIILAGVYDNTGKTLALSDNTGPLLLGYNGPDISTIKGGTISTTGNAALYGGYAPSYLDGVTLAGHLVTGNTTIQLKNGLTLANGTVSVGAGNLLVEGSQTIGGTGEIRFDSSTFTAYMYTRNAALTLGPGVTLRTAGRSASLSAWDESYLPPSSITNYGSISATDSQALFVGAPTFTNFGTVRIANGSYGTLFNIDNRGTVDFDGAVTRRLQLDGNWSNSGTVKVNNGNLSLGGTFSTASLLSLQRTGTGWMEILGTIDNTGATLALDSLTGSWPFLPQSVITSTGAVTGGTVTASSPAGLTTSAIYPSTYAGAFDNLTIDTDVTLGANLELRRNVTLPAGRTLRTTANVASGLTLNNAHLLGAGTVLLDGGAASLTTTAATTDNLIGPGITVRTGPNAGSVTVGNFAKLSTRLTLQGLVSSEKSGTAITVAGTLDNQGTFRVSNGGILRIVGTVSSLGTLQNQGGSFEFAAAYDNTGKTLALDDSTGSLLLYHSTTADGGPQSGNGARATIKGGTLSTAGSAIFRVAPISKDQGLGYFGATTELDNITLAGRVDVDSRGNLYVRNGMTLNNGVINLANDDLTPQGYNTYLTLDTFTPNIAGTGQINFTGSGALGPSANYISLGGATTLAPGVSVRTVSTSGTLQGPSNLTNFGTIAADAPGKTLHLEAYPLTNNGTLRASGGGTLEIAGNWSGTGNIVVDNGSFLLGGTFSGSALSHVARTGGTITLTGFANNGGNTIALDASTGSINLAAGASVSGGALGSSGGAAFNVVGNSTLTSVAIGADVNVSPNVKLTVNTPVASPSTGHVTLSNSTLEIHGNAPLAGPLDIVFNGDPNGAVNDIVAPVEPLTIGAGVTIRTGANDGRIGYDTPFTNQGTILSNLPGGVIDVFRPTNQGLIRATSAGVASVSNFTNAPTGTLSADAGGNLVLFANTGFAFSNAGTISADAGTLTFSSGTWSNSGSISAVNNSTVLFGGSWTNTGTISLNNSTLQFTAALPASLGNFSAAGSTIKLASGVTSTQIAPLVGGGNTLFLNFGATLDNTGSTLDLTNLAVNIASGTTLKGGVFTSSSTTPIAATGGTLNGVTLNVPLTFTPLTPTTSVSLFTPDAAFNRPVSVLGNGTTTRLVLAGNWSNTSNLSVDNGSLTIPVTGSNTGTITLNNTALSFASFSNIGTVSRTGGTAVFTGTLNNAGATFDPNLTPVGAVVLGSNSRIAGGTIASGSPVAISGGGQLPTTFDAVTLAAGINVLGNVPGSLGQSSGILETVNGLTFANDAQISFTRPANFRITGTQTYSGAGSVVLNGASVNITGDFTLGPNVTLRAGSLATTISFRTGTTPTSFTNQGLISADSASATSDAKVFTLSGTAFTNQGTIQATNAATLSLGTLSNISTTGTLTGGTYKVFDASNITFPIFPGSNVRATIANNAANIFLSGPTSSFAALVPLATNAGSLTLTAGRTFTTQGDLTNSGSIILGPSSALKVHGALTNSGLIDLTPGALILDYSGVSPVDDLRAQLLAGRHGGDWLGPTGITSATAAADSTFRLAVGYAEASQLAVATWAGLPVDSTAVVTQVTSYGDANIDGKVDANDYALLDRGLAMHLPGWVNGDFNYDNTVDAADFLLIDRTFVQQTGTPSPSFLADREARFGDAYVSQLLATVPEPGGLLLSFVSLAVVARRRRRQ